MMDLIDGQIYRWRWADAARDADCGPYRSYHCKSQIAVVKGGRLIDTFWSDLSSEHAVALDQVNLVLLCDQSWPKINAYEVPYYDRADVVDTRHSNNSHAPIYLRPGAQRSAVAILEAIEVKEDAAKRDMSLAEYKLARMTEARKLLAQGKLTEVSL